MDEDIEEQAEAYLGRHGGRLAKRLGFGIHGIVFTLKRNAHRGVVAVKICFEAEPYLREKEVYSRLLELGVTAVGECKVPKMLAFDDELFVIEMSVVKPPYVLDFAGAWLDFPPEFSEEIWEEWERKNREQFGEDWPRAQVILGELAEMGIHMLDPSPSNIRFR